MGTFGYNFTTVLPLLAKYALHAGALGLGLLTSALGVGSVIAALGVASARRTSQTVIMGAALVFLGGARAGGIIALAAADAGTAGRAGCRQHHLQLERQYAPPGVRAGRAARACDEPLLLALRRHDADRRHAGRRAGRACRRAADRGGAQRRVFLGDCRHSARRPAPFCATNTNQRPRGGAQARADEIGRTVIAGYIALFASAVLGGGLNSVAGGGSFLTFPALIVTGVAPIKANATSTVALWPGSVASVGAYRRELGSVRHGKILSGISLLGGLLGALLLVHTPSATFSALIPYLLLVATLLFAFNGPIKS